jgi:hypothetical protein
MDSSAQHPAAGDNHSGQPVIRSDRVAAGGVASSPTEKRVERRLAAILAAYVADRQRQGAAASASGTRSEAIARRN